MSRSHLYGRPVTEWSTPPPMLASSQAALTQGSQRPTALSSPSHPAGSDPGVNYRDPHDLSWYPLTTVATPSLAPSKPLTTAHTHRHSVPSEVEPVRTGHAHKKYPHSGTLSVGRAHTTLTQTTHSKPSPPPSVHEPHPQSPARSHSASSRGLGTSVPPPDSRAFPLPGSRSGSQSPIRRSLSERQLYRAPSPGAPTPPSPPPSRASAAAPKPPTAKVAPLVGTPAFSKSDLRASSTSSLAVGDRVLSGVPSWDGQSEKDRIKRLAGSLSHSVDSVVGGNSDSKVSHDYQVMAGDLLPGSVEKWKALVDTKDRIIAQKNHLIDRQKQSVAKLQQEVRENEVRLHQLVATRLQERASPEDRARLQGLELETARLRAEFSEAVGSRDSEIKRLSKKLDAAEYELQKTREEFLESSRQATSGITTLEEKLAGREEMVMEVQKKLSEAGAENSKLKQHVEQLNSYLGNMPTLEEHQAAQDEVRDLRARVEGLSARLAEREAVVEETTAGLRGKEELCSRLEVELSAVRKELEETRFRLESQGERLSSLEPEHSWLRRECQRLQKLLVEADSHCHHELQAMRERHKQRFTEATAKLRTQHRSLAKRSKALEMQLLKNSDAVVALNSELQLSQGTIGELKSSVRELVSQNQDLVEKNIGLQEVSTEALQVASTISESQTSAAQEVGIELGRCVEDFESLVNLSASLLEGRDPSASLVLGVKGTASVMDSDLGWEGSYEAKLEQVRRLQAEVERLRTIISDQFANQVSSACYVQ